MKQGKKDEISLAQMEGITFKCAKKVQKGPIKEKIKTKAKKKKYITGLHGSDSSKMKAEIKKKRANRHKNK